MGARWAWFARCVNGHVYGNFSGGPDNCYECNGDPVESVDCEHLYGDKPCNCRAVLIAGGKGASPAPDCRPATGLVSRQPLGASGPTKGATISATDFTPVAVQCKCGHSLGGHNRGSLSVALRAKRGLWGCLAPGCDCVLFETLECWAERLAQQCPHCNGTGLMAAPPEPSGGRAEAKE